MVDQQQDIKTSLRRIDSEATTLIMSDQAANPGQGGGDQGVQRPNDPHPKAIEHTEKVGEARESTEKRTIELGGAIKSGKYDDNKKPAAKK